jgi:hypothetical protein
MRVSSQICILGFKGTGFPNSLQHSFEYFLGCTAKLIYEFSRTKNYYQQTINRRFDEAKFAEGLTGFKISFL